MVNEERIYEGCLGGKGRKYLLYVLRFGGFCGVLWCGKRNLVLKLW